MYTTCLQQNMYSTTTHVQRISIVFIIFQGPDVSYLSRKLTKSASCFRLMFNLYAVLTYWYIIRKERIINKFNDHCLFRICFRIKFNLSYYLKYCFLISRKLVQFCNNDMFIHHVNVHRQMVWKQDCWRTRVGPFSYSQVHFIFFHVNSFIVDKNINQINRLEAVLEQPCPISVLV